MTANENTAPRDRSPAYPIIPIEIALSRLTEFDAHFKRISARPEKVGDAWKIKTKAYADRMAAALKYFGLLEYKVIGKDRYVVVSEEGRKYLLAEQEETKREVAKAAALRPKQIAKFWGEWGADRPADGACLDELVLKNGFGKVGAREFLKVYDATITYSILSNSDKIPIGVRADEEDLSGDNDRHRTPLSPPPPSAPAAGKVKLMDGERIVFTEESTPQQYLKIVASGDVDETMLDALEDYVKRQKKRLALTKHGETKGVDRSLAPPKKDEAAN